MAKQTKTPANFTFLFIAVDGFDYPVTIEFEKRLPNLTIVGMGGTFTRAFNQRASIRLHTVLPRMRVIVTVDRSSIPMATSLVAFDLDRVKNLRESGASLADQLFVALQARKF